MKLTSFSVIFAIIASVILSFNAYKIRTLKNDEYLEIYNKKIIEQASSDATSTLKKSAEIYGGSIITSSELNPELVFNSFFKSLCLSLSIYSDYEKEDIKKYFPLLCLIENDGISLSSYVEIKNSDGVFAKRILMPKYRFFFEDNGIIYYPSLSGEITVLYEENGLLKEESGKPKDLLNRVNRTVDLDFLKESNIEELIHYKIQEQISMLISEEIERHENEMAKLGFHYDFFLPKEYENNAFEINSPCFIAIMQGYPLGKNKRSNTMNICKMDIKNQGFYAGFIENGIRYYLSVSDDRIKDKTLIEAFTDEFSALKAGYYKYHH